MWLVIQVGLPKILNKTFIWQMNLVVNLKNKSIASKVRKQLYFIV